MDGDTVIATQESSPAQPKSLNPSSQHNENEFLAKLRERARSFRPKPDIYHRKVPGQEDIVKQLGVNIADWTELRRKRDLDLLQAYGTSHASFVPAPGSTATQRAEQYDRLRPAAKSLKSSVKAKSGSGRQYTSKYRGVHQTFPTKRWEAQFRRNGKPTSLGCFDHEEEAAKAYDKMMLWCELHNAVGVKGGVTNFEPTEYQQDIQWLQQVTQDELVQILRSDGRRQAAARTARNRKDSGIGGGSQQHSRQKEGIDEGQDEGRHERLFGQGGTSMLWQS